MNKYCIILCLILALSSRLVGQDTSIKSSFNGVAIDSVGASDYSFLVSGHFYGDKNTTGYPSNTLLANLDWINNSEALMVISLGDLFANVRTDIPKYKTSFFDKLDKPLFNAVGNHDVSGDYYQSNFGDTYFFFEVGGDVHVILDSEINDGSISGDQLIMLEDVKTLAHNDPNVKNVFFYSHRTLWSNSFNELEGLFTDNTQSMFGNNFETEILPLIDKIQADANVYWFSGSLGNAPASFFQFKSNSGVQYAATAIRGLARDAVLVVTVNNGNVLFRTKSLTGEILLDFDAYNVDFWKSRVGKTPFNFRLLPLYFKNMILHKYFWIGFGTMLFITLLICWRMRKKRINL